jgi:hypothetical protein
VLLPTFCGRSALSETQLLLASNQNSFRTPTFLKVCMQNDLAQESRLTAIDVQP